MMQNSMSTHFTIEVEQEDDGRWIAEVPEISGVLVYGLTQQEAISNVQALALRVIADKLVELREKIAQGTQQIRQGNVIDGETVFEQLQVKTLIVPDTASE